MRLAGPLALAGLAATVGLTAAGRRPPPPPELPSVRANDNTHAAGAWRGDTLALDLEITMATWRPEADDGPAINVAAFAERGRAPEIPGPLVRVPAGTVIVATIRNALTDSAAALHGFVARPAADDSVLLRPGESRTVQFTARTPGTYFYYAILGNHSQNRDVDEERDQLAGALVVDPPGGSPADRILMMNIWSRKVDSTRSQNALTINGRSWPHTERIAATVGDTVRWRVINATVRTHPMHLHGFYFTVDSRGTPLVDTIYRMGQRRLAVTEGMLPYTTMDMHFVPDRPGNWLFHCHIGYHVVPGSRLDPPGPGSHDAMAHDAAVHMAGLITGLTVGAAGPAQARGLARTLRLFVQEGPRLGHAPRTMSFVLQRGRHAPRADSVMRASSLLVLTRGQPTDIVITNRLGEPAAIHWHGIELESFSDGVTGWSGRTGALAPSIAPGDSFTARLTLPRAGTFIYHTHMNDIEQLTSGLYGGIVVLEPGEAFAPAYDHVYVAGWDGANSVAPRIVVNGDSLAPRRRELEAGARHRFRFVNIGVALRFPFAIYRGDSLVSWRGVAKDGADLPSSQAVMRAAEQVIQVGETYDFEFVPAAGEYRLVIGPAKHPMY
nr:multicopper oxidase domain-containing protein [Gemmatimonadales bacterium]